MPYVIGPTSWTMQRDEEGHREYKYKIRVGVEQATMGPRSALNAPGLPLPGSPWIVGSDADPWAYCRKQVTVTPVCTNEPNLQFDLEYTFSSKPEKSCKDANFENPLLQPQTISGSFETNKVEAVIDRFGDPVTNSAYEQIRGAQNEWDESYPTVKVEQNVPVLQLSLIANLIDCVNDRQMWGMERRKIRMVNPQWSAKFYGQCFQYYTRSFEFKCKWDGWDRDLLDEGTKVLSGRWTPAGLWQLVNINGQVPNPNNPAHFIRFKDRSGENARVILDGFGQPWIPDAVGLDAKWWCLKGVGAGADNREVKNDTCKNIIIYARRRAMNINGPYDTEAEARQFCNRLNQGGAVGSPPNQYRCNSFPGNRPGVRHTEVYAEANLFVLGIPAVIG